MNLYYYHSEPKSLIHHDKAHESVPCLFAPDFEAGEFPDNLSDSQLEVIAKDPEVAYYYAGSVLENAWPVGELAIMKSPEWAYKYATDVLRREWPEAEPYIMRNPEFAYQYAKVFKSRWPEAELYIMKDPFYAALYAKFVLEKRWPEAEPIIKTHAYGAAVYANFLNTRWPDAQTEELIKADVDAWHVYKLHFRLK